MNNSKIEEQYNKLPDDIKHLIESPEVGLRINEIGKKHNLLLNQIDDLADETGLVMLGIKPSAEFLTNIMKRLEIDRRTANDIAVDINTEIIDGIRASLQKIQSQDEINSPTPIEQAGRFTIDKPPVGMGGSPQYKEDGINKEAVLKGIEDPVFPVETPMIDHLLTTPVITTTTRVEIKKGPDPYREQV